MGIGSHFHDWIDYNPVIFSIELLEWVAQFWEFGGKKILASRDFKMGRFGAKMLIPFQIQFNKCVTSFQDKLV